jgi:hypothetical protein
MVGVRWVLRGVGGSKSDLDAFVNAVNYGGLANLK